MQRPAAVAPSALLRQQSSRLQPQVTDRPLPTERLLVPVAALPGLQRPPEHLRAALQLRPARQVPLMALPVLKQAFAQLVLPARAPRPPVGRQRA
jgi:hypothetical protein